MVKHVHEKEIGVAELAIAKPAFVVYLKRDVAILIKSNNTHNLLLISDDFIS